ncbi:MULTISPECIES: outer membrane beta-barrel protein [unclassified Lentimicrobium]|uniref:outer membrane beta-barrel protein n=1 Tax=unclassified Lentimicrobium TaxID=2677434 RepID=UPI0015576A40|nr:MULTISPECIES: outer membrane beta-barrel protein [unclassified Lentimicrobium]NPD48049.1 outer membrane beta-barrel protein [Lentimicrobium sp. S6]NPD86890.1 outer membrane beta-barrel protein [Lentimicrobium sp. L6]
MKKLIILIIAILPLLSFSQKNELMLGLSIGMSSPLGDFASNEYIIDENNELISQGQFAKTGLAFDFSASYRLGYYAGFAGRIIGGTNKTDNGTYSDAMTEILQKDEANLSVLASSKGWGNGGLMAGAYFVLPIQDLYIDARIMAGYMVLFAPQIRYYIYETEEDLGNDEAFVRQKYSAGGFAYDIGLGIKYKFGGNKFLQLNGDYIGSKIVKDNIKTLNPFTQDEEYVNMDIEYQNLTFTIGLGYMF